MAGTGQWVTAALCALDFDERYAALRSRVIDFEAVSLHPDEFAAALRATGRNFVIRSWRLATLSGSDDGRPYDLWAQFEVQSGAHEAEFGVACQ